VADNVEQFPTSTFGVVGLIVLATAIGFAAYPEAEEAEPEANVQQAPVTTDTLRPTAT